ncbi:MAG: [Lachnospiraceae bacterium]|nr:[FeFe] hydrogenase H-cluster maturation GTPase HydF [Lachnospiraceae bacterium]
MGLNDTVSADRTHIAFFGKRNAGKSSLVNAVTDQQMAIVSDVMGTTTDPVYKSMELLPLGPVMIIDTPGYDDEGELGKQRVLRTLQVMNKTDIGILVTDDSTGLTEDDVKICDTLGKKNVPYVVVLNKSDLTPHPAALQPPSPLGEGLRDRSNPADDVDMSIRNAETALSSVSAKPVGIIRVSALKKTNIWELKELIASVKPNVSNRRLVADLISPSDMLVLVMPQDESAPKGRLILPQVQMIRDIIDEHAMALCVQPEEVKAALESLRQPPKLVITDSQAFKKVAADVPDEIMLTSFSILLARYKGYLDSALKGINAIKALTPEDTVLIAEGCTYHRQCNDIGTVKIPNGLRNKLGFDVKFDTVSGNEFPLELEKYKAVIHCGGCMLNEREIMSRIKSAEDQGVPVTNYGILLAWLQGILDRSIRCLI